MKNFATSTRLRGIPSASLEAATKNPVITVIDTPTSTATSYGNQSPSSSPQSFVKARNVFEFALVHDILKRDPNWMEKVRVFRGLRLKLPDAAARPRNLANDGDMITYHESKSTPVLLPQNWWLHYTPFIHPSYWENLARRSLHDQLQGMKLITTSLSTQINNNNNNNNKTRKQIEAAAEEILTTLQQELPLLKNQFSMIPLQNIGDSTISLSLATLDFTIVPPPQQVAANHNYTAEEMEIRHKKVQRNHRKNIKKGLQDAEFISAEIVSQPRREVAITRVGGDVNGEKVATKSIVTIPSWSDDLLLLKDNTSKKAFDLLALPSRNAGQQQEVDDDCRIMKEEACVGSFIAMLGSIGVEFGVENASRIMWRLAEEAQLQKTTK